MILHRLFTALIAFLAVLTSSGFGFEDDAPTFDKIKSAWRNLLDNQTDYSMVVESHDGSGTNGRKVHLIRKGQSGAAVTHFPNAMMLHLLNENYAAVAMNGNGDGNASLGELRHDGWELKEMAVRSPETGGGNLTAQVIDVAGPITMRGPRENHNYIGFLETNAKNLVLEQREDGGVHIRIDENSVANQAWPNVQSANLELEGSPHYLLKQLNTNNRDGGQFKYSYTYTTVNGVPHLANSVHITKTPDGSEVQSSDNYSYLPIDSLDDSIFKLSTYGLREPGAAPPEPRNELGRGALVLLLLILVMVAVMFYRSNRKKIA